MCFVSLHKDSGEAVKPEKVMFFLNIKYDSKFL